MGYVFILASFPYIVGCVSLPIALKNMPRKLQCVICFYLSAIAFALMGPSYLLELPEKLYLILIGLSVLGFIQPMCFLTVLPEVVDALFVEYKIIEGSAKETEGLLHDNIAALYNLWYSTASLFSPVLGGFLYDRMGFQKTMDISMFTMLGFALFYTVFNCGCRVYKYHYDALDELDHLKEAKEKFDKLVEEDSSIKSNK